MVFSYANKTQVYPWNKTYFKVASNLLINYKNAAISNRVHKYRLKQLSHALSLNNNQIGSCVCLGLLSYLNSRKGNQRNAIDLFSLRNKQNWNGEWHKEISQNKYLFYNLTEQYFEWLLQFLLFAYFIISFGL